MNDTVNVKALKAEALKCLHQVEDATQALGKELRSYRPKSRCKCVGHAVLWGGAIVAALAGLCALGRWLKS